MTPGNTLRPLLRTTAFGVPTAALSFFVVMTVLAPLSNRGTPWMSEALVASAAAAVWMAAGLLAGRRTILSALLLFGIGAVASYVLNLRLMYGVSAYYGIPAFIASCLAGIAAGTQMLWSTHDRRHIAQWVAAALCITCLGFVRSFWSNPPGDALAFRDSAGESRRVGVFGRPEGPRFVWIPNGAKMHGGDSTPARGWIEYDPGSGHTEVSLAPVSDTRMLAEAKRYAALGERLRTAQDIEAGNLPAVLRRAPVPLGMGRGTVWIIDPAEPRR